MKLYPDRTLPLMTARTFHCSPQARELGEACASINEVVSQYRQAFQLRKNHDKNHLLQGQAFADRCLAAVLEAANLFGDEQSICSVMADLNTAFPGAGSGYLAALGLSCGLDHVQQPRILERVTEVARSMGSSLIASQAREGYHSKYCASRQFPTEATWSDQTLGYLLLNGPECLLYNSKLNHQQNFVGMLDFYSLISADADNHQEFSKAVATFEALLKNGNFPVVDAHCRALRQLVMGSVLTSIVECNEIAQNLGGNLENRSVSVGAFNQDLLTLSLNPDYLAVAVGPDILQGYRESHGFAGDDLPPFEVFTHRDQKDPKVLKGLSDKLAALADFLGKHIPQGDLFLGAMILDIPVGEALRLKQAHGSDEMWLHRKLMGLVDKRIDYKDMDKAIVYLKALLMAATTEQLLQVCNHHDAARVFAYQVTGNYAILNNMENEHLLANILQSDIGL